MRVYLQEEERDEIFSTLTTAQQEFLHNHVKRGVSTIFTRKMAELQGLDIHEGASMVEIEEQLRDWQFHDYVDAGPNWQEQKFYCQCGRKLRRRYSVLNMRTGEVIHFGETHFQTETGIPAHVFREIKTGIEDSVDLERDEILSKVRANWKLQFAIPEGVEISEDIQAHFDLNLPLLDRQVDRLRKAIRDALRSRQTGTSLSRIETTVREWKGQIALLDEPQFGHELSQSPAALDEAPSAPARASALLFDEKLLTSGLKAQIETNVNFGISSAFEIAEELIREGHAPDEHSATGTPTIYPLVVRHLERMANANPAYQVVRTTHGVHKDVCLVQTPRR